MDSFENCCKVAFNFDYSIHKCDCWLKIVNHWDKPENSVSMCGGKKTGLKLLLMETKVEAHTRKLLKEK